MWSQKGCECFPNGTSIVRKKLLEYLEETKMSKYKFAQRSGISLSTIYDIIRKEDYDIRESNIIKICHGMQIEPFDLFQTSEEILVLEKMRRFKQFLKQDHSRKSTGK